MPLPLGAMAALVAPRRPTGHEIDIGLTLDILDFVAKRGVAGIVLLGATGEFVHYAFEERTRLICMAVRRSTVPVLVNVSHSTVEGALQLAEAAASAGASGLLLMPPHFFRYRQAELAEYFFRFSSAPLNLPPVLLYNIPFFTNPLEAGTIATLLRSASYAGIKDSSGDAGLFDAVETVKRETAFLHYIGNDELYASHRLRADGVISGCACAVPELIAGLERALLTGNTQACAQLAARLSEFVERISEFPTPFGVQAALSLRGFPKARPDLPLSPPLRSALANFDAWFPKWWQQVEQDALAA